jgi:hypothetical protein
LGLLHLALVVLAVGLRVLQIMRVALMLLQIQAAALAAVVKRNKATAVQAS